VSFQKQFVQMNKHLISSPLFQNQKGLKSESIRRRRITTTMSVVIRPSSTVLLSYAHPVALKRGRPFKRSCSPPGRSLALPLPISVSLLQHWTTVNHPPPHFIRRLPPFLRKNHFELSSLHRESIHFIPCITRLFIGSKLNKSKTFWLLRVKIAGNVHIANFSNASKCTMKVFWGYVVRYITDKKGDPGRTIIAS